MLGCSGSGEADCASRDGAAFGNGDFDFGGVETASDFSSCGVGGMLLAEAGATGLCVEDAACAGADLVVVSGLAIACGISSLAGAVVDAGADGSCFCTAGGAGNALMVGPVVLGPAGPGAGGNGAIVFSLAAAAAAAEAYFSVSPGGRVGGGAGFMAEGAGPAGTVEAGVCSVARAGRGDLKLFDGLRAASGGPSDNDIDFCLIMPPFLSIVSGSSSCTDWLSCDETLSKSPFIPQAGASASRFRSS